MRDLARIIWKSKGEMGEMKMGKKGEKRATKGGNGEGEE